jgi:wyosine [tRNA(Phe)-imidazoG37] synthetase (radical SAM superfamily)
MMNYVFGPVPPRRLGKSLGIDPIPLKTCNWNCVYCQLGRTRPLTNARHGYNSREGILAEVQRTLEILSRGKRARIVVRHSRSFWSAARPYYAP